MEERARKLTIASGALALFVGFIFLTKWTGDDPGTVDSFDDAEKSEIAGFCVAISSDLADYETALRAAAGFGQIEQNGQNGQGGFDPGGIGIGSGFLETILRNLADKAPEDWAEDAHAAAEGLSQAYHGDLTEDEIDGYVAHFRSLQDKADKDCSKLGDVEPDNGIFGPSEDGF
jgi:hypothetical protein